MCIYLYSSNVIKIKESIPNIKQNPKKTVTFIEHRCTDVRIIKHGHLCLSNTSAMCGVLVLFFIKGGVFILQIFTDRDCGRVFETSYICKMFSSSRNFYMYIVVIILDVSVNVLRTCFIAKASVTTNG